jgi:transketolase
MATLSQLINAKAIRIAELAVCATTAAGSGHPTSALSLAHLIATLMYHTMRWRPEQPRDPGADRLVLSEGHAVPIIYAACADLGVTFCPHGRAKRMTVDDLMTLRKIDSPIDGHPNPALGFPFFDAATGSLGQGLSVAGGLGCAARIDGIDKVIYCIIGDGESREGQIWEAAASAAKSPKRLPPRAMGRACKCSPCATFPRAGARQMMCSPMCISRWRKSCRRRRS